MTVAILALIIPAFIFPGAAQSLRSPRGDFRAVVRDVRRPGALSTESAIEVWQGRHFVSRRSFASSDGEHGFRVVKAGWTPDGRFLLVSIESSGGHQPWHVPLVAFDTRTRRYFEVDRHVGQITSPFELLADGRVRLTLLDVAAQTFDTVRVFRIEDVLPLHRSTPSNYRLQRSARNERGRLI